MKILSFIGSSKKDIQEFPEVVYVLHCFQKKSKRGIETPHKDLDLIKQRLKRAEEDHKTNYLMKKRGEQT